MVGLSGRLLVVGRLDIPMGRRVSMTMVRIYPGIIAGSQGKISLCEFIARRRRQGSAAVPEEMGGGQLVDQWDD